MKKILSIALCALMVLPMVAQEKQKGSSIALGVVVEELAEPFPANAKLQIENKLKTLITRNGIASMDFLGQFFITAFAVPQQKEVIPGPPAQIAEQMDITFYIADYINQKIYATATLSTRGVGTNETKSYMDAIKHINLNSTALKNFVEEGRAKIVDYYNAEAENIIAKAKSLAHQKQYEQALYMLTSIPSECEEYMQSLAVADEIYQMYVDNACNENLAAAKAAWAAEQNATGAANAGYYLVNILPDAKCYSDAEALYAEIKAKVLDDWKFEMKKWQDGIDLESQRINAQREIGVAWGKGQQPTTTNIGFLGR